MNATSTTHALNYGKPQLISWKAIIGIVLWAIKNVNCHQTIMKLNVFIIIYIKISFYLYICYSIKSQWFWHSIFWNIFLNFYRHLDDMIAKLESAGLGFYVKANETQEKLGILWYYVHVFLISLLLGHFSF